MMGAHRLEIAFRSDVGLVRTSNQDRVAVDPTCGALVLADGMGGHRAGEVASRIAADRALAELRTAQTQSVADKMAGLLRVGHVVEMANQALLDACAERPELSGMGTTMVVAAFRDGRLFYAHVGDSRLYRVRLGRMRRLTHDHSLVQRLIDDGVFLNRAEARQAGIGENVLTRSLGMQQQADVDVGDALIETGDTYLICSDGLHGLVPDSEIARILRDPAGDLEAQAQALLNAALGAGGNDNVSLILARPLLD
jgi:protein phosphatase